MKRGIKSALLAVFFVVGALAPAVAAETLFKAAHVHPVSGPELSPGAILVREGRIVSVGKDLKAPGAVVVDLGARHVFPGLIAADAQLGLVEISSVRGSVDTTETGEFTPDVRSWVAVNPDSELIPVTRANGITHAEASPDGGTVIGQSGVFALSGWTWEQMTVRGPAALHVNWPSMSLSLPSSDGGRGARARPLDEQVRERDRRLKELEDFFDEARAYDQARTAGGPVKSPVPAWEAMRPYVRGELPVVVHAEEARQIKSALAWAASRRLKLVIAGGRDAWQVAALLATNRVPVIYKAVFTQPVRQIDSYDVQFRAPSILHQAGVPLVIGTEERPGNLRNLPYAAAQAMAFGLEPAAALKSVTLAPAQVLGLADQLGSLEAGKEATFIAASGPILDIRSRVERMWIAGQEVKLDSRHTRLYEKYRARPAPKAGK